MRLAAGISLAVALLAICAAGAREASPGRFRVASVVKEPRRHPRFGEGSSFGFAVNGRQGPTLTMQKNLRYEFDVAGVDCAAPFGVFADDGVALAPPRCGNATLDIVLSAAHVGRRLRYGSAEDASMGGAIEVVDETFCNKYSRLQDVPNYSFIERVCNATFAVLAQSGPGMIEFFTGLKGPTNYFVDSRELDALRTRLVTYFGNAFGCTDPDYPEYHGRDLALVHHNLEIHRVHFQGFNTALLTAMQLCGVLDEDIAKSRAFLEAYFHGSPHGICNSGDCRTAYPAPLPVADLVRFLGQRAILHCSEPSFPGHAAPDPTRKTPALSLPPTLAAAETLALARLYSVLVERLGELGAFERDQRFVARALWDAHGWNSTSLLLSALAQGQPVVPLRLSVEDGRIRLQPEAPIAPGEALWMTSSAECNAPLALEERPGKLLFEGVLTGDVGRLCRGEGALVMLPERLAGAALSVHSLGRPWSSLALRVATRGMRDAL